MNTLPHHVEADEEASLESATVSRTTKLLLAGLLSLGILDGYQDYAQYAQEKSQVAEVQKK